MTLTIEQKAARKAIYEQVGGGTEYHRLCAEAGIATKRNGLESGDLYEAVDTLRGKAGDLDLNWSRQPLRPNAAQSAKARNKAIFVEADKAGKAAAESHTPAPMTVVQHLNPLDDDSPVTKVYEPIMDGVCGFAWVCIRPGTSSFARYIKKNHGAHKGYPSGMDLWIGDYGQSMERKEAYARAFAAIVRDHGIQAFAQSRMD